ncbi:hypothetical protein LC612_30065 [Nostoc sp. CHAB 5834]|nr:hypothetical protein [Nostoc sp. CHAB 5834]
MEPLTTTIAISTIVGYLAKKLKDNKSVQGFFDDFTEATVNWIKPIFIRADDSPKDSLKDLQDNPDSKAQQGVVKSTIEAVLERDPQAEVFLQEMIKVIQQKDPTAPKGNIITQYHSGGGDNVGGDKIIHHK